MKDMKYNDVKFRGQGKAVVIMADKYKDGTHKSSIYIYI